MRQLVAMLFDAGAAEVHVRVSSPPVIGPCYYGIDLAGEDELVAAGRTVEEVRELIGATSLAYLSVHGLVESVGRPADGLCRACLTRRYPTAVPADGRLGKLRYELLASTSSARSKATAR
jgi:amidophosphoribosyltransferase